MAESEKNPHEWGVDVRKTANGFVVYPPRDFGRGDYHWQGELYVFRDASELAAWLLKKYAGAA